MKSSDSKGNSNKQKVNAIRLPVPEKETKHASDDGISIAIRNSDNTGTLLSRVIYSATSKTIQKRNLPTSRKRPFKQLRPGSASRKRRHPAEQVAPQRQLIPKILLTRPPRFGNDERMHSSTLKPQPPNVRKPSRMQSKREQIGNTKESLTTISEEKDNIEIFDICNFVGNKTKIVLELERFKKTSKDESILRQRLLYPEESSFLAKLYTDANFKVEDLLSGGIQYLQKNKESDNRYDLKVINPSLLSGGKSSSIEFFTLSKAGLTYNYGKQNDFTTIEQFEREHAGFHKIMKIRFFSRYRKWKSFTFWKKNVRNLKIESAKRRLNASLFILSSEFSDPLLEITKYGSQLLRTNLLSIDLVNDTYTLNSFQEAQYEQRKVVTKGLQNFANNVYDLMVHVCKKSLNDFLEYNGFPQGNKGKQLEKSDHTREIICDSDDEASSDDDEAITFTERAAMRTQCRRLMRFLQMVDYIVMGIHVRLGVESTQSYLDRLRNEKEVMFEVNILLKKSQLFFSPLADDFKGSLDICLFDSLRIAATPLRLLTKYEFMAYTQPFIDEHGQIGPTSDVETIMMNDPNFRLAITEINKRVTKMFSKAKHAAKVYDPFVKHYLDNLDALENMVVSTHTNYSIEDLLAVLEKYRKQEKYFEEGIERIITIGLIKINGNTLFNKLRPSPSDCLNKCMFELLPNLGDAINQKALDELKIRNNTISASPLDVQHFVELRKYLEETNDRMYDLEDECMHVMKFFKMMEEQQIEISEELSSKNFMMYQLKSSLSVSITKLEDNMSSHMQYFGKELKDNIVKLKELIQTTYEELQDQRFSKSSANLKDTVEILSKKHALVQKITKDAETYTLQQDALAYMPTEYDNLPRLTTDLKLKKTLWDALYTWTGKTVTWLNQPFEVVDPFVIEKEVQTYFKVAVSSAKKLPDSDVPQLLRARVEDFKLTMPVVNDLRTKELKARHWDKIHSLIGYEINGIEDFTCGLLIEKRIMDHADKINEIALEAINEAILEEMLTNVTQMWKREEFEVLVYKDQKGIFVLGAVGEVMQKMDDSLVTLGTIMGSRYVAAIREKVEDYQKKLVLLQETLEEWLVCQRNWMYLENIFAAPDIQRQLPAETGKFEKVDKSWKGIMRLVNTNPNCIATGTHKGRKELFAKHNATLDDIQKRLEEYLETKRASFPRFYFLSNDELLEILAQTKDPRAVQPYLRKCFDNLVKLEFVGSGILDIRKMISSEGEEVALGKNLKARGTVEEWLTSVEDRMRVALRGCMKDGALDYFERERLEWVFAHPAQVVNTMDKVMWCNQTEKVLRELESGANRQIMDEWLESNLQWLLDLTFLIRKKLTKLQRKVVVVLATINVHARDIVRELISSECDSPSSFLWQKQLRYNWDAENELLTVKQSNAVFNYGYEYEGATGCLVITPLTDRCWMTISGALHLKLGASPAGPAGTGKTESSKDLAKAMAIQCIVFNCSDQIDIKMMSQLFKGLSSAGAWTCLDEFNRIDIEVLSVIAQQMLVLRQARLSGHERAMFDGYDIPIRSHHVIITMNPGYAGRTELPDNLKVMFRPVAMMVPDYALIAEIMLFAEGFDSATILSRKMTKMYKLSSEQLSQQRHYDYGLRAVRSVLVMAGSLKRGNPDLSEDVVLIKAMRDSNVPKFLDEDLPLFHAILKDLFPGVAVPYDSYGELEDAIRQVIKENGYQESEGFLKKVIQLFETQNVRFGVSMVGPTGGGKTTCYQILSKAMTALALNGHRGDNYDEVALSILNPKSVTMGELYGEFNPLSQEWCDGLASTILRTYAADTSSERKWTIFDGPIDALWIENMNTVLDDNMTLCLANGERIKLKTQMRCIFEVQDLEVASPATVSRLGVMYVTPAHMGWQPYVDSWIERIYGDKSSDSTDEHQDTLTGELKIHLKECFIDTIDNGLEFIRSNCKEPIESTDLNLVVSLCYIFQACFSSAEGVKFDVTSGQDELKNIMERTYIFSYTWSIGGAIADKFRENFDDFMQTLFDDSQIISVNLPRRGTLYDSFLNKENEYKFEPWSTIVPAFQYDTKLPYFQMLVPTETTVQSAFLMEKLLMVRKPTFFTGVTGTGKSVTVQQVLTSLKPPQDDGGLGVLPNIIGFSAQTNAAVTQSMIESVLEKKSRTTLGAPVNRLVVVFVDDVNMPTVEEYGAQPPVELLRQFADFSGFFDREKQNWRDVIDTVLFVAGGPPGGGRNDLTPRFVRHFNILCLPPANEATMNIIFGSILAGFLQPFKRDVQKLKNPIVQATVDMFYEIQEVMLPTPQKAHYTFNLRDVSKVFQGILQIETENCKSQTTMTRLWIHEIQRVFHDRLISDEDKVVFNTAVTDKIKRIFKSDMTYDELFVTGRPIIFGDFFKPGEEKYAEFEGNMKLAGNILTSYLEDYNVSNSKKMNLVFFADAVNHVTRISRIMRQPRGNALLIGIAGSGKRSLTKLCAFVSDYRFFQIELKNGYGRTDFHENIKEQMLITGVEGNAVTWIFPDSQIVEESFVEDINNILNSGDIPNLWESDEKDKIVDEMRPVMKRLGKIGTRANCLQEFNLRIRDNLHIVLSFSPVGDAFRSRLRNFPSLINCTTIDWFNAWPESALQAVAEYFLKDLELETEEMKADLVKMCVLVHSSVHDMAQEFFRRFRRIVYRTPKSYLNCIDLYLSLLRERQEEESTNRQRLEIGVKKLEETNEMVNEMQITLTDLQPVLVQKAIDAEELLKQTAIEQIDAEKIAKRVSADEAVVKKQADETAAIQADAQKDLDRALPALKAAVNSLKALDKKDITEMKSFANPPKAVKTVLEAVCILLGKKPDWDTAKKVMTDSAFMTKLQKYDKDNIEPKIIRKLKAQYLDLPEMDVETVQKVSKAATSLCMWARAMVVYDEVAKEVGPKREKVKAMNAILKEANNALKIKQDELQAVLDKVANLKRLCDETVEEKQRLEEESEKTKARLGRAEKLTVGLAEEYIRWKEGVEIMKVEEKKLIGNVFLSAACVSYYGPFTGVFRNELMENWRTSLLATSIPGSESCTLRNTIGKPVQIRQWQINSLPADWVSTDNAIMCTRGLTWPLMIDPQGQANRWVKKTEKSNHLEVTKMNNSNLLRVFENNIRNGTPVLIEDIGEFIDPSIENVLSKNTHMQGTRRLIRLGDSDVEYNDSFRFYMTTKMANPHYAPEVCIKVTIINFTVTKNGLEDQLLARVVKAERPDIEQKKDNLVISMADDNQQLKDIESKILKLLAESEGNILDNIELISVLASSKTTSNIIKERVAESEKTEIEITELRNKYKPMSVRGSIIYFVIADFSVVDPMYQYSLDYYCRLFDNCLAEAERNDDLEIRLFNLIEYLTDYVYKNICRGLFEKHKNTFAFVMCVQILREKGELTDQEWSVLLRGPSPILINDTAKSDAEKKGGSKGTDKENWYAKKENPDPSLLSDNQWDNVLGLEIDLPYAFEGFSDSFIKNIDNWRDWIQGKAPHRAELPGIWSLPPKILTSVAANDTNSENEAENESEQYGLTAFQKLLIIRCLKEEKLIFAASDFVSSKLGESFALAPTVSMLDVYNDTNKITPCIFVLVSGADPTELLLQLAKSKDYGDRLQVISLGQGQGPRAEAMIKNARESGDWVLLQNCHLAKSWMTSLERQVFDLIEEAQDINDDFRLFLTSFPASYFPVSVLQNSIKMTNEPPQGLRANINRSFGLMIPEETWEEFDNLDEKKRWKKLLFGVTFFHGMAQERRKFGPLGWNIRYEFNDSDLQTSIEVLRNFLIDASQTTDNAVPWDSLTYVTGDINYGGRVTDDWDRRCLMQILSKFYTPDILNDSYRLSDSGIYKAPGGEATYEHCLSYVSNLPLKDDPEIFGMHENANVASQLQQTTEMVNVILMMQPRASAGGGVGGEKTPDEKVQEIATSLEDDIPDLLDRTTAGKRTFEVNSEGIMDSLATVLSQEMKKFNRLLHLARKTVKELQKAIKGLVVMSADLEGMYGDLLYNNIPRLWKQVNYDSLKPLASYVVDLKRRIEFMRTWLVKGRPNAFPLYLFFFPQGFLTGVLQNHARKHSVAISALDFSYSVVNVGASAVDVSELKAPYNGVYIYGLWMEGARFDQEKMVLNESFPGEMFSEMPMIHFLPTKDHIPAKENYLCPVYKTTVRAGALSTTGISTNYVVAIELKTNESPNHWVFEGVACILNTND